MTIGKKLWLSVTALLVFLILLNALVVLGLETTEIRRSFEQDCQTFARLVGPQAFRAYGETTRTPDDPELMRRLSALAEGLPSLRSMTLISPKGSILAQYPGGSKESVDVSQIPPEGSLIYVEQGGETLVSVIIPTGARKDAPTLFLKLTASQEPVTARLKSLWLVYGLTFTVLMLLSSLIAWRMSKAMASPIEKLKAAALSIRDGDLTARVEENRNPTEIAELARAFNTMAAELEENRNALYHKNAELEKAYDELKALWEEISGLERMAAVGRTAAGVSHEIDNPLGVILGTAELLALELEENPGLREDAQLIVAECRRIRKIVRDLLDFSKPSGGEVTVFDITATTQTVLRGLAHHPSFKSVEIVVEKPDEALLVKADPDGIKQVLLNLLLNAANAMEKRGRVVVRFVDAQTRVRVEVEDGGPGICPEYEEKIFDPFFTTGNGTGLGLPISRKIVESAGGSLYARNPGHGGCVFTVELLKQKE